VVDTTVFAQSQTLAHYFSNWVGDTKAFVTLEPALEDYINQNLFIVSVKYEQQAVSSLNSLAALDGSPVAAMDTFLGKPVYFMPNGAAINQVFGNSFTRFDKVWFTISNGYAFFGNDMGVLELALEKVKSGDVLSKNEATAKVRDGQNQLVYFNPGRSKMLFRALLKPGTSTESFLDNFSDISAMSEGEDRLGKLEIEMSAGNRDKGTGLLWKTKLKAVAIAEPKILTNPVNGAQEVFMQDTATNIYLLNSTGQIVFSRSLGEQVVSDIWQMDYYNNGNVQYLFNSATHIFIIDRAGNDVAAYPLRLSYPATAGLTMVNDSLTNSYRYFVPCSNNAIYGYQGNGRPLPGWSPKGGVGHVENALSCFAARGKEHIAAFSNAGKLSLLNKKGIVEWAVENIAGSEMPRLVGAMNFKFLGAEGTELMEIDKSGNKTEHALVDSAYYFDVAAINDTDYNYYFANYSQLRCYDRNNQFKKSAAVKDIISDVRVANEEYVVITGANKIYVYDLALSPIAELGRANVNSFKITDLFGNGEIVVVTTDKTGTVSCTRVK
jgi:hypothetical protein